MEELKREGLIRAVGVSVNRWEPENVLETLRTGQVDAVQVIYNIFDQAPEDALFPLCRELNVGVIARVPFDEGTLTGTLTMESRWPEGDWRNTYFVPENLRASVERAESHDFADLDASVALAAIMQPTEHVALAEDPSQSPAAIDHRERADVVLN